MSVDGHSEYYHSATRHAAPEIVRQSAEAAQLKGVVTATFSTSGSHCAFGIASGCIDIYETAAIPTFAFRLGMPSSCTDGRGLQCAHLSWSISNRTLFAVYVYPEDTDHAGLACLWDLHRRADIRACRLPLPIVGSAFICDSEDAVIAIASDMTPLCIHLSSRAVGDVGALLASDCRETVSYATGSALGSDSAFSGAPRQVHALQNCEILMRKESLMSCIVYVLVKSSVSELCLCRLDMKYIESDAKWHAVLTSQKPVSNVEGKVCSYVLSESGAVVSGNVVIALTAFISSVCESRIAIYVYDKKTDSIVNTIGWSDVKSSIDNRHVGQLCRLSPTASSTEFSYLSSLKATPQVSACSDSLAVIRIETAGDRSTAFVSAEVSAVYQWPRFHKFASSPNGDFVYLWGGALADGVAILRTGAQSTFAGVEYPLGFLRVDDSTMYLEREDEFDKSITVQEDKASTKSAKTSVKSQASGSNAKKKNSRKWFEVDEPEGGAVSLTYTADYNAIINAEYFQSVKRRRLENGVINDVVMMSAEIDLVNCELHPLKNDHSLPVLPSDFAFTTESKSNITSIGPSKDNRLMLKGGAFIADPTRKILTSSSHKRPQSVAKLSAAMKAGVDPVNEYGAPPFGSPYLIDAFNRRLGGLTANDCTSRVPKLLNGISNNYFNKLQNLHGTILSNLDKHIEISARIRAAVDNTDRLRNHRMELKERADAQHMAIMLKRAQVQALKREKAADLARAKALASVLAVSATYLPAVKCEPILVEEADHLADKVDLQSAAEKIDNGVAACNELVTFSAERTEPNIGFGSGVEFGSVEVEESNEAKVFSTEHLPIEVAVPHALTDDNAVTAENIEHNQLSRANITEGTGIILN